jgi:excisionase family DNA binding protein
MTEPIAVPITEAARLSGVGRSTIYIEIKNGNLKTCKIRNRRVVPMTNLRDWMAAKGEEAA